MSLLRYPSADQKFINGFDAKILRIEELRQKSSPLDSTLLIDLEIPEGKSFKTAGNCLIFPENCPENVQKALDCVGLQDGQLLRINPSNASRARPCPELITAGNFFRRFVDLQGVLKKSTIKSLAKFVDDATIKAE